MSTQNLNQFKQSAAIGELDLQSNPNPATFTCKFDPSALSTARLVPGEGAQLVDLGASDVIGPPIVGERTDNAADAIFGVKVFTTKKNQAEPNEIVQIAGKGAVVFLNAGAAILRGAAVELVLATPGNVVTKSAGVTLGTALDKATAADQVIRVLVE